MVACLIPDMAERLAAPRAGNNPGASSDGSGQIEDQDLRRLPRPEDDLGLVAHRGAVAGRERSVPEVDGAARDLVPGMAPGGDGVADDLARLEERRVDGHVLVQGEGPVLP